MTLILLSLPWIGVLAFLVFVVRMPRELPGATTLQRESAPSVSVIVPARNEALNIGTCVTSLSASEYPDFEIIVVDDRSEDGTADLVRSLDRGQARRLVVLDGDPLPEGWLGKPWACHQGAQHARGEILLFTDADTVHGSALMAKAVSGLQEERADLLTVVGLQLMETFWERLVQPQVFLLMVFRFPRFEAIAKNGRWRDAIANGQFIMFPRAAYDTIGGHEAVHDEVVEDLALAQLVKREGMALRIRRAEDDLATRMYRSLRELVSGWSKNVVIGGLQSVPAPIRPVLLPVSLLVGVGLWIAPPLALVVALWGFGSSGLLAWAATVYALSAIIFALFSRMMRCPALYGLLYPLGAAVGTYIFVVAWVRGTRVQWKGRTYDVRPASERP